MGYVDENLFLLKRFDPNKILILDNSFDENSTDKIKLLLMKYYHEGYFEMKLEDFLALNKPPEIK